MTVVNQVHSIKMKIPIFYSPDFRQNKLQNEVLMQNKKNLQYQSKYNESITIVILTSFEGIVHSTGGQQILGWKTQQKHKYSIFCTDAPNKAKFFMEIFLFHSNLRKTNTSSFEKVVGVWLWYTVILRYIVLTKIPQVRLGQEH